MRLLIVSIATTLVARRISAPEPVCDLTAQRL
jgi:hypothetical protein